MPVCEDMPEPPRIIVATSDFAASLRRLFEN